MWTLASACRGRGRPGRGANDWAGESGLAEVEARLAQRLERLSERLGGSARGTTAVGLQDVDRPHLGASELEHLRDLGCVE